MDGDREGKEQQNEASRVTIGDLFGNMLSEAGVTGIAPAAEPEPELVENVSEELADLPMTST